MSAVTHSDVELPASGEYRGKDLDLLMLRNSPLAHPDSSPCLELRDCVLSETRVLIIGAGGLGCELLKNVAMLGIKQIDIIDLDRIDITNLNRQFLFRQKDVGKFKSEVAAEFVSKRVPGVTIKSHVGRIQDFKRDFYSQFQVFLAGLDNIEARRWLNSLLYSFLEYDSKGQPLPETIKILIDGGHKHLMILRTDQFYSQNCDWVNLEAQNHFLGNQE